MRSTMVPCSRSIGPRAVAQPARRIADNRSLGMRVMYAFIMKMRMFGVVLFFAATALRAEITVLAGGRLIDGYGGPPIENAVIVIDGNTIRTVGTQSTVRVPEGAKVIDTNGFTMMPGLMDMHVHLMILGHGDYDHWFATYASQYRDVIMPISAKELLL